MHHPLVELGNKTLKPGTSLVRYDDVHLLGGWPPKAAHHVRCLYARWQLKTELQTRYNLDLPKRAWNKPVCTQARCICRPAKDTVHQAPLKKSRVQYTPGDAVDVWFNTTDPPAWFPGVVVSHAGTCIRVDFEIDGMFMESDTRNISIRPHIESRTQEAPADVPVPVRGGGIECLAAALCLWSGLQDVCDVADTTLGCVAECVAGVSAAMPRRCIDREQLVTWSSCMRLLGTSVSDYMVKLVSLTFVVCAHFGTSMKRLSRHIHET